MAAVDDEVVALRLAQDGGIDRRIDEIVAFRGTQRRAQISSVFLAETHVKRAGTGEPHAIARLAKVMGKRRDEAEPSAGFRNVHVARRSAGAVVDILHGVTLGKAR